MSVVPATEERLFRVGVHIPGFTWGIGSTDDLGLLVEDVDTSLAFRLLLRALNGYFVPISEACPIRALPRAR